MHRKSPGSQGRSAHRKRWALYRSPGTKGRHLQGVQGTQEAGALPRKRSADPLAKGMFVVLHPLPHLSVCNTVLRTRLPHRAPGRAQHAGPCPWPPRPAPEPPPALPLPLRRVCRLRLEAESCRACPGGGGSFTGPSLLPVRGGGDRRCVCAYNECHPPGKRKGLLPPGSSATARKPLPHSWTRHSETYRLPHGTLLRPSLSPEFPEAPPLTRWEIRHV